jgi:hypothetical protein
MPRISLVFAALTAPLVSLGAQSLGARVTASDGQVQVIYPSRPNACGDGQGLIGNVLGRSTYYSGNVSVSGRANWSDQACVRGPVRVVATVISGEITRMRSYVGPIRASASDSKTINASASEAAGWLGDIAARGSGRAASDAILPLVLADTVEPWPLLVRIARDENRPRDVRRAATLWLSMGVTEHLGIADTRDESTDDEMRSQAVFVLSQRPKSESVPELMDLARTAKHASARRAAIFWLGQTGDDRAIGVYAELLGIR